MGTREEDDDDDDDDDEDDEDDDLNDLVISWKLIKQVEF